MKKIVKILIYLIIFLGMPFLVISLAYWPLYKEIKIENSETSLSSNSKTLNLSFNEEYLKYIPTYLPSVRHLLCFNNHNRVYLIHADSKGDYKFKTDDVSQLKELKEKNVGAMEIVLRYFDGLDSDPFYRYIGQEECDDLNTQKLSNLNFASSTVKYHHVGISANEIVDLAENEKLYLSRIIAGSDIDTSLSKAYISTKWDHFLLGYSFVTIFWIGLVLLAKLGIGKIKNLNSNT